MLSCNFCGKTQKEVEKLIAGPGVYICNECIGLADDILKEEEDYVEEDRVFATLSKDHLEMVAENGACLQACQKVVEEAVKHWEQGILAKEHLWVKIRKTYAQDLTDAEKKMVLSVDHITGELRVQSKTNALKQQNNVKTAINDRWVDMQLAKMNKEPIS